MLNSLLKGYTSSSDNESDEESDKNMNDDIYQDATTLKDKNQDNVQFPNNNLPLI